MSVLGSQLEIDLDPDGELTVVPRHVGNTGTGCYKMHDHTIRDTKKPINVPVSEKVEATYMYAEPEEEEDEDPEEDGSQKRDGSDNGGGDGQPTPSRAAGGGSSSNSSSQAKNSATGPAAGRAGSQQANNRAPNMPHLLDAPLQGAQPDQNQLTPAVAKQTAAASRRPLNSPSQKSVSDATRIWLLFHHPLVFVNCQLCELYALPYHTLTVTVIVVLSSFCKNSSQI